MTTRRVFNTEKNSPALQSKSDAINLPCLHLEHCWKRGGEKSIKNEQIFKLKLRKYFKEILLLFQSCLPCDCSHHSFQYRYCTLDTRKRSRIHIKSSCLFQSLPQYFSALMSFANLLKSVLMPSLPLFIFSLLPVIAFRLPFPFLFPIQLYLGLGLGLLRMCSIKAQK